MNDDFVVVVVIAAVFLQLNHFSQLECQFTSRRCGHILYLCMNRNPTDNLLKNVIGETEAAVCKCSSKKMFLNFAIFTGKHLC